MALIYQPLQLLQRAAGRAQRSRRVYTTGLQERTDGTPCTYSFTQSNMRSLSVELKRRMPVSWVRVPIDIYDGIFGLVS